MPSFLSKNWHWLATVLWVLTGPWVRPVPWELGWPVFWLLGAAFVLMPGVWQLAKANCQTPTAWRWVFWAQLPAALCLWLAFIQPVGLVAGLLSLPWLLVTALVALLGAGRLWGIWFSSPLRNFAIQARLLLSREHVWTLAENVGLVYLVVGGGWATLHRFGLRPLGFDPAIVLMTALHFHFAGCALPILAGAAGRAQPGPLNRWAALGVCASVPLVAIGITATQLGWGLWLESLAALVMAASGLGVALAYARLAHQSPYPARARVCWGLAASALTLAMLLAALYALRAYLHLPWLSLPFMWAIHGTANAFGLGFLGLLGWRLAGVQTAPDSE